MQYSSNSPWGEIDCCEELYPGIYLVSTPSHGGVQVEWESAMLLSPAARKCGFLEGGFLWFEEDCCEQVVLRELLDKGLWQIPARIKEPNAFERSRNIGLTGKSSLIKRPSPDEKAVKILAAK